MFVFFFSDGNRRSSSIWIPILYILFAVPLILYPDIASRLFCLALSIGSFVYAAARLLRYARNAKHGWAYDGDKWVGIVFVLIGLFCLFFWRVILSFLPLTLGLLLLLDGLMKLPLAIDAFQMKFSSRFALLASTAVPLLLGLILLLNPFGVTRLIIRFFGISLIADGICELVASIFDRRSRKDNNSWHNSYHS